MILARRYLAMAALVFWLGGFTFYVSVVVPLGTKVLRSALRQGFITREVTYWLNVSAAVALALLAADLLGRDPSRRRRWARRGLWLFMAACQVGLFVLWGTLDGLMVSRGMLVTDPEAFYPRHRAYLWLHTAQWAAGLVYIGLSLAAWRAEDRARWEREAQKSPAADCFGVAQSPKLPRGGTEVVIPGS